MTELESQSTLDLVARVQSGDDRALEHLVGRYLPRLRRWASRRLPGWARHLLDTDDLVQDTLIRTIRNLDRFEPRREGGLQVYVRRALQNRIRDEIRRVGRHPQDPLPDSDLDEPPDRSPSPLESAIGEQAMRRYERALARVSEEDREAIVARLELRLPYREVAEALEKSGPDAARMAVSRAIVRLAREMERDTG